MNSLLTKIWVFLQIFWMSNKFVFYWSSKISHKLILDKGQDVVIHSLLSLSRFLNVIASNFLSTSKSFPLFLTFSVSFYNYPLKKYVFDWEKFKNSVFLKVHLFWATSRYSKFLSMTFFKCTLESAMLHHWR